MAFQRPLAIHNITLPGPNYSIDDRMAALYDQLWGPGGVSTVWVASLPEEIDVDSPGPGSFSFLLKRVGQPNAPQFNLRVVGTKAAPSTSEGYVAINPDGDAAVGGPIVNSETVLNVGDVPPPNSNQNISGGIPYGVIGLYRGTGFSRLGVWEFDDAVFILALGATYIGDISWFGDLVEPPWPGDKDGYGGSTDLRMGLYAAAGFAGNRAAANYVFYSGNTNRCCMRIGLGQNVQTIATNAIASQVQGSWHRVGIYSEIQLGSPTIGFVNSWGPDQLDRYPPWQLTKSDRYNFKYGEMKYLYFIPDVLPYTIYKFGTDHLMGIAGWTSAGYDLGGIAIVDGYDPTIDGTFT